MILPPGKATYVARSQRTRAQRVAARHKLPAVYYRWLYVADAGLISYGPISLISIGGRRTTLLVD